MKMLIILALSVALTGQAVGGELTLKCTQVNDAGISNADIAPASPPDTSASVSSTPTAPDGRERSAEDAAAVWGQFCEGVAPASMSDWRFSVCHGINNTITR